MSLIAVSLFLLPPQSEPRALSQGQERKQRFLKKARKNFFSI
jgi:hypothetical protein